MTSLAVAAMLACDDEPAVPGGTGVEAPRAGRSNLIAASLGPIQNLGGDIRPALALTPGESVALALELPCGTTSLQLGIGGRLRAGGGSARFRLELEGAGRRSAWEHEVSLADPKGVWTDLLVPLGEEPPCGQVTLHLLGTLNGPREELPPDPFALAFDGLAVSEVSVAPGADRLSMLFLIDTLRADATGAYGAERPVSPHLDRFSRQGALYTQAHTAATWTRSSVGSLFTSRLAYEHGALGRDSRLDEGLPTLAEVLGKGGVHTAAFVTNGNIGFQRLAFHRGFDRWKLLEGSGEDQLWAEDSKEIYKTRGWVVLPELQGWLRMPRSRHAFVYVHTTDPHAPYAPLAPYKGLWDMGPSARLDGGFDPDHGLRSARDAAELGHVKALYDEEILLADEVAGKTLATLKGRNASVLVVSDHGESFGEKGAWEHGSTIDEVELKVPLLIRAPGFAPGSIRTDTVSLLDVPATLCALMRVEPPPSFAGRPLATRDGPALAVQVIDDKELLGAVDGFRKSVLTLRPGVEIESFELRDDPGESRPGVPTPSDPLASSLRTIAARFRPGVTIALSGFASGQELRVEAEGRPLVVDAVMGAKLERDGEAIVLQPGARDPLALLQDPGGTLTVAALGEGGELWRHEIDAASPLWESPSPELPRAKVRRGSLAGAPLPPPTGAELEALKSLGYVR